MERNLRMRLQLALADARRIAVLGIGSELRGDDQAGLLVARLLLDSGNMNLSRHRLKVFCGATVPENLSGEIKRYHPSHLILIDAVDLGSNPGTVNLIRSDAISGPSFSTHAQPLSVFIDYLRQTTQCEIVVVGIQPKTLEFGSEPSLEVESSARELGALIEGIAQRISLD